MGGQCIYSVYVCLCVVLEWMACCVVIFSHGGRERTCLLWGEVVLLGGRMWRGVGVGGYILVVWG